MALAAFAALSGAASVASAEFSKYWREITGGPPPAGAASFAVDPSLDAAHDEYRIVSEGAGVRFTGASERAVLYAVYDFLERRGGCRWFWDGDRVPKQKSIDLAGLDVREKSRFEYRAVRQFAHRGLTRFQAEMWGPEEWTREIDWMLKRRLNCFMPRIGMDDVWQKAYPDVVPYPDAARPLEGVIDDFRNRSPFWPLQFRGELRRRLTRYAQERGLMVPTDFGTMTHWYSTTPAGFLEKYRPPFLPDETGFPPQPDTEVWDVFQRPWLDRYWRLTEASIAAGYGDADLLHTIGLGERRCFTDRAKNLRMKKDVLAMLMAKAAAERPGAKILLAGWDFYSRWTPEEVRSVWPTLDPSRVILWDYSADAGVGVDRFNPPLDNDFTRWGVVGRFPYVFGLFVSYEPALDVRADYGRIASRERVAAADPMCRGYILWPEACHTDTFLLRYFTANAWRPGQSVDALLPAFCRDRYGDGAAADFERVWRQVLPVGALLGWGGNYGADLMAAKADYRKGHDPEADWRTVESARAVLPALAALVTDDEFVRRDAIDLARTVLDRRLLVARHVLDGLFAQWTRGEADGADLRRFAQGYLADAGTMADLLEQSGEFSLCESLDRLRRVHEVPNPDFDRVLFDNAANDYCRSHQSEIVRGWYLPVQRAWIAEILRRIDAGDRTPIASAWMDSLRTRTLDDFRAKRLEAFRPRALRSAAALKAILR